MTKPMHFDGAHADSSSGASRERYDLQITDYGHGNRLPAANDLVANSLTADMLRRLATFTADDLTLQALQEELAALDATYDAAFSQLEETITRLVRDVRAARLPIFLMVMRRRRKGVKQLYLYWRPTGAANAGLIDPQAYLTEATNQKFEPLHARCVQAQITHFVLQTMREIISRAHTNLTTGTKQ